MRRAGTRVPRPSHFPFFTGGCGRDLERRTVMQGESAADGVAAIPWRKRLSIALAIVLAVLLSACGAGGAK